MVNEYGRGSSDGPLFLYGRAQRSVAAFAPLRHPARTCARRLTRQSCARINMVSRMERYKTHFTLSSRSSRSASNAASVALNYNEHHQSYATRCALPDSPHSAPTSAPRYLVAPCCGYGQTTPAAEPLSAASPVSPAGPHGTGPPTSQRPCSTSWWCTVVYQRVFESGCVPRLFEVTQRLLRCQSFWGREVYRTLGFA